MNRYWNDAICVTDGHGHGDDGKERYLNCTGTHQLETPIIVISLTLLMLLINLKRPSSLGLCSSPALLSFTAKLSMSRVRLNFCWASSAGCIFLFFVLLHFRHQDPIPALHDLSQYQAPSSSLIMTDGYDASIFNIHPSSIYRQGSNNYVNDQSMILAYRAVKDQTFALIRSKANEPLTYSETGAIDLSKSASVMPMMGNSTIRAELGRATWRLMHTMAVCTICTISDFISMIPVSC